MDDTPNVPGALSLIAEHLPKWWADEGTKDLRDGLSNFVPTDAVDAGLMLVGGPGGKMARKAGAALIAGGASTDAEAGIFKKLPGELRGLVRLLAANAKKADPAEAAIEFANNGLGGKLARGGHGVVDSSKLVFNPNGAALHTHGYAEQALPSFKDFETWAAQPAQKYLGVVKPSRQGKPGAVIIAPKGSALPAQGELAQFQKSLFKSNPNLVNRLDFGESDASKWKWLLDKANADELDLFLHNTTAPAELMYPGFKTPKATLDELLQASLEQKGSRGEDALLSYLSDGYEDINAALRNGEGADEVARNMDKLFSANEGVRPLENDLAVWRYSTSFPKHDPAFLSTTLSEEFARKNAGAGQVKKIIVPAGERAFDTRNVAPYAYEQEVLLPRGGNLTPIDENTLMFNRAEQGYAQGGAVNKPQGMEHTTSSSQDASTQPLTGSALKALVRGWIAGTAGLPGDLEGLARKGVNWSFGPGGVNVDETPALPTSAFYKDWLPGKQQGDEMINDIGSVFGGVGATKPVSLAKGALSRAAAAAPGPMAGSRAAMRGVVKLPNGQWINENAVEAANDMAAKAAKIEALGAGYLKSLPSDLQRALREHVLSPVNGILRSSNRARAEALDEAFYNAPELPKGVVLYRGENAAGPLKEAAVGGDRFPLYLPTSLSKEKALQFKKFAPDGVGSFNDITPTGDRQFLTPFNFASEQEVILPRSGIVKKLPVKPGSDASYSYDAMYADGGSVRNALNAAVGGSGLVKAVGNTERAVGNIASGNASLGDLKSLRDMASQLGYTVPGLSQALGIAGVAKAGYNLASDPSGMNAAKLAATVNPIAAQALGLYQAATDPTPGTLVDVVSSFNPIARAYNGLANSFNFATIGQVMANLGKIADPNTPAQLRDMFSNTPLKDGFNREQAEIDAMGPTVQDAINAYNQAQALQTNPSLNPASPDFMGPQADGGAGYTGVMSGGHGGDGSVGGYGSNSYGGAASSVGGSGGYGGYA